MNRLQFEKRRQILHLMVEGNSLRGIARLVDVSPVTVLRYLKLAGHACEEFHDKTVRGLHSKQLQLDEIWSFVHCKRATLKNAKAPPEGAGNCWTWTCIDDSKLIVTWLINNTRTTVATTGFLRDIIARMAPEALDTLQVTSDMHGTYKRSAVGLFNERGSFAQIRKIYTESPEKGPERKYSPGICVGSKKHVLYGDPDPAQISTHAVEKHNQTMRQHMKRFARLTAAHSKKIENHAHMVALYTVWYNFARINSAVKVAPAMAAGLSTTLWGMDDLVRLVDNYEAAVKL